MNTQIIVAIITGTFSLLAAVVRELVKAWLDDRKEKRAFRSLQEPRTVEQRKIHWRAPAIWALSGTALGYIIGLIISAPSQGSRQPPVLVQTPIPRGDRIMEIHFDNNGDGNCNDYDGNLLGYEGGQYYIQPASNGYIAICHARDDLPSQGSLEVDAWMEDEITEIYGFALLFGWRGAGDRTSDACVMGIRRKEAVTQAFYSIRQAGERLAYTRELPSYTLDNARHNLRVVLYPDGRAYGYMDESLFVLYDFERCGQGPVGMMAWGPGDQKIYFDDLKLFALP